MKDRKTDTVINALIKHAHKLPTELYRSLTWDRGREMSEHKAFTLATDIKVYFCDPHSPWQRGSNENTDRTPVIRAALYEGFPQVEKRIIQRLPGFEPGFWSATV